MEGHSVDNMQKETSIESKKALDNDFPDYNYNSHYYHYTSLSEIRLQEAVAYLYRSLDTLELVTRLSTSDYKLDKSDEERTFWLT